MGRCPCSNGAYKAASHGPSSCPPNGCRFAFSRRKFFLGHTGRPLSESVRKCNAPSSCLKLQNRRKPPHGLETELTSYVRHLWPSEFRGRTAHRPRSLEPNESNSSTSRP